MAFATASGEYVPLKAVGAIKILVTKEPARLDLRFLYYQQIPAIGDSGSSCPTTLEEVDYSRVGLENWFALMIFDVMNELAPLHGQHSAQIKRQFVQRDSHLSIASSVV
jgi:hypothetical protein